MSSLFPPLDLPSDIEYFALSDFDLFDDDEAFQDLCDKLDFDPISGRTITNNERLEKDQRDSLATASPIQNKPQKSKRDHDDDEEDDVRMDGNAFRERERNVGKRSKAPLPVNVTSHNGSSTASNTVHVLPMQSTHHLAPAVDSTVPSLAPDDIRVSYGSIFINAINQQDDALSLDAVLDMYCVESLCCVYKFMGKASPHNSNFIEVHGRDAVGKYWHGIFQAYPDYFYELLGTKMKVLNNEFCSITSQFAFAATKVLDMVSDYGNTIIVSDPSKMDEVNGGVSILAFTVDGENRQVIDDRPPVENTLITGVSAVPRRVSLLGTITYYVNPEQKVYKIEVLYSFRNEEDDC